MPPTMLFDLKPKERRDELFGRDREAPQDRGPPAGQRDAPLTLHMSYLGQT